MRPVGQKRMTAATAIVLFSVVGGMVGLAFASVPLYRLFCQVTGYGGTPKTENVKAAESVTDNIVTVRFDTNVNSKLPWRFKPVQRQVRVRIGEQVLVNFVAANLSDKPITGSAVFNVSPFEAAPYFNKIQCFCFSEQTLAPGQEVTMPVVFYIDPEILKDPDAKDAHQITLSYTFYRADEETEDRGDKVSRAVGRDAAGRDGG